MKPVLAPTLFAPALFAPALSIAATLIVAPAAAQSAAYYVATPVAAPVQPTVKTGATLWRARGPIFFAARAPERPVVLCRLLAERAGPIAAFAAGGRPLDANALSACNGKVAPGTIATK